MSLRGVPKKVLASLFDMSVKQVGNLIKNADLIREAELINKLIQEAEGNDPRLSELNKELIEGLKNNDQLAINTMREAIARTEKHDYNNNILLDELFAEARNIFPPFDVLIETIVAAINNPSFREKALTETYKEIISENQNLQKLINSNKAKIKRNPALRNDLINETNLEINRDDLFMKRFWEKITIQIYKTFPTFKLLMEAIDTELQEGNSFEAEFQTKFKQELSRIKSV